MNHSWFMLILAGILEIGWAISLKLTEGWTKIPYLIINVLFGLGAAYSLAQSMKTIPLATAYLIWKGIAILGIVVYEFFYDQQPITVAKAVFGGLILVGIVGLKATQPATP